MDDLTQKARELYLTRIPTNAKMERWQTEAREFNPREDWVATYSINMMVGFARSLLAEAARDMNDSENPCLETHAERLVKRYNLELKKEAKE